MNDNLRIGTKEALDYLKTGGLGEVIGLTEISIRGDHPKVQMDTDMAMALCILAAESLPTELLMALAECVDANDALHVALADDNLSNPNVHRDFVAAQLRETKAIETARALCIRHMQDQSRA